jgi:hypothetical protein
MNHRYEYLSGEDAIVNDNVIKTEGCIKTAQKQIT